MAFLASHIVFDCIRIVWYFIVCCYRGGGGGLLTKYGMDIPRYHSQRGKILDIDLYVDSGQILVTYARLGNLVIWYSNECHMFFSRKISYFRSLIFTIMA